MIENEMVGCISDSMDMSLSKLWEMVKDTPGSLVCCSPWGHKESDATEWLNNNKSKQTVFLYSKKYLNIGFEHAIILGGAKMDTSQVCILYTPSFCTKF